MVAALDAGRLHAYVCDFPSSALKDHPKVVTLPHLGASTGEAEENCAVMVAEQLRDFLENGNISNSVNYPGSGAAARAATRRASRSPTATCRTWSARSPPAWPPRGLNIADLLNKSRGEFAYTLIDADGAVGEELLDADPRASTGVLCGAHRLRTAAAWHASKPKKTHARTRRQRRGADARCDCELGAVRARIDAVDEQIHALINERARLAQQVGISKTAAGRTVDFYRPEREAQVLRLARERNAGPLRDEEVLRLFREIMSACLAQQEPLKVAFLGPEGTFTQTAVLTHFGHSVRALPLASIDEVFHEVEAGERRFRRRADRELHRGHGQPHARSLSQLAAEDLRRGGAAHPPLPDGQAWMSLERIERVCSHPQSLAQCRGWLEEHLPGVEQVPVVEQRRGRAARAR